MDDVNTPNQRHSDDARADDGPPTDAVSDEVKSGSADLDASAGPTRSDDEPEPS